MGAADLVAEASRYRGPFGAHFRPHVPKEVKTSAARRFATTGVTCAASAEGPTPGPGRSGTTAAAHALGIRGDSPGGVRRLSHLPSDRVAVVVSITAARRRAWRADREVTTMCPNVQATPRVKAVVPSADR